MKVSSNNQTGSIIVIGTTVNKSTTTYEATKIIMQPGLTSRKGHLICNE